MGNNLSVFIDYIKRIVKSSALWLFIAIQVAAALITLTFTNYYITMEGYLCLTLLSIIWSGYKIYRDALLKSPKEVRIEPKFDVFISSPMAAYSRDKQYQEDRSNVLRIIRVLEQSCEFKSIYYAGKHIDSPKEFDPEDIAINSNIYKLRESRIFLMLYPRKIVSSVLVEAGAAIALGIPSIYFVRDKEQLPFVLKSLPQALGNVKIYECPDIESIIKLLEANEKHIFSFPLRNSENSS